MIKITQARSYHRSMDAIAEFMLDQDVNSAPRRSAALEEELDRFARLVVARPGLCKHYDPPEATDEQKVKLASLMKEFKLDHLRERVLQHHSLLYGHSDTRIVFLSVKHHRQAAYPLSVDE